MDRITIKSEDGEEIGFFVLEQTRMNGMDYLLVTETEDESEDAEAYILKDVSRGEDTEAVYEFVEDDNELEALAGVFSEMIDDTNITSL